MHYIQGATHSQDRLTQTQGSFSTYAIPHLSAGSIIAKVSGVDMQEMLILCKYSYS